MGEVLLFPRICSMTLHLHTSRLSSHYQVCADMLLKCSYDLGPEIYLKHLQVKSNFVIDTHFLLCNMVSTRLTKSRPKYYAAIHYCRLTSPDRFSAVILLMIYK